MRQTATKLSNYLQLDATQAQLDCSQIRATVMDQVTALSLRVAKMA